MNKEDNKEEVNWIDEMILRESLPLQLRKGTNAEFCEKYGIVESNYYYHSSKPENRQKAIDISLNNAKKHTPEVLENLGERAKENNADAKLYLQFVLQLAERTETKFNFENDEAKEKAKGLVKDYLGNTEADGE